MNEDLGNATAAVLHQLANSLTAAEGYGSLLVLKHESDQKITNRLQQSLAQAQILLQSLASSRRLLRQTTLTPQSVALETTLATVLAELQWLLSRHRIKVQSQRIYQVPAVLADPLYTAELIRLILYSFALSPRHKTIVQLTLTARHKNEVRLGFAAEVAIINPDSSQEALTQLIGSLAQRAQIQFAARRGQYCLVFAQARQLPLIAVDGKTNEKSNAQV